MTRRDIGTIGDKRAGFGKTVEALTTITPRIDQIIHVLHDCHPNPDSVDMVMEYRR